MTDAAQKIFSDPPPGCALAVYTKGKNGGYGSAAYEWESHLASLWSAIWRPAIFRYAAAAGISWTREGKRVFMQFSEENKKVLILAQALSCAILADELQGDARAGAIGRAVEICVAHGYFPHVRREVLQAQAAKERGIKRAMKMHGLKDLNQIKEWQDAMDQICKKDGMTCSKAWRELEFKTGSKQETMSRYNVRCPIPARRGRFGKSSP